MTTTPSLSTNLARARSARAQAEESFATYGPLGRRLHRDEVDRARDSLAGWQAREQETEAALSTLVSRRAALEAEAVVHRSFSVTASGLRESSNAVQAALTQARRDRGAALAHLAEAHPDSFLAATLGPVPEDRQARAAWDKAAVAMLHYRSSYHLAPDIPGLGEHPGRGHEAQARAFEEATTTVGRAQDHIASRSPERLAEVAERARLAGLDESPYLHHSRPHLGPQRGRGPSLGM